MARATSHRSLRSLLRRAVAGELARAILLLPAAIAAEGGRDCMESAIQLLESPPPTSQKSLRSLAERDRERMLALKQVREARPGSTLLLTLDFERRRYTVIRVGGAPERIELVRHGDGARITVPRDQLRKMADGNNFLGAGGINLAERYRPGSLFEFPDRARYRFIELKGQGGSSAPEFVFERLGTNERVTFRFPALAQARPRLVEAGPAPMRPWTKDYGYTANTAPREPSAPVDPELLAATRKRMLEGPRDGDQYILSSGTHQGHYAVVARRGERLTLVRLDEGNAGTTLELSRAELSAANPKPLVHTGMDHEAANLAAKKRYDDFARLFSELNARSVRSPLSPADHESFAQRAVEVLKTSGTEARYECQPAGNCLVYLVPASEGASLVGKSRLTRMATRLHLKKRTLSFDTKYLSASKWSAHQIPASPVSRGNIVIPWEDVSPVFENAGAAHELVHASNDSGSPHLKPGLGEPRIGVSVHYLDPKAKDFEKSTLYGGTDGHAVHEIHAYLKEAAIHVSRAERLRSDYARTGNPQLLRQIEDEIYFARHGLTYSQAFMADDLAAFDSAIRALDAGDLSGLGSDLIRIEQGMALQIDPRELIAVSPTLKGLTPFRFKLNKHPREVREFLVKIRDDLEREKKRSDRLKSKLEGLAREIGD